MKGIKKLQRISIGCIILMYVIYTLLQYYNLQPYYIPKGYSFYMAWYRLIRDGGMSYLAWVLWRRLVHKEKRTKSFVIAMVIFVIFEIMVEQRNLWYRWLWVFWPFLTLGSAKYVRTMKLTMGMNRWKVQVWKPGEFWGSLIYYVSIFFILGMIVVFGPNHLLERDIPGVLYLGVVICAAWYCSDRKGKSWKNPIGVIFFVAFLKEFIGGNYRVEEIIASLENPITAISGTRSEVNWLGNRLYMLEQIWLGQPGMTREQKFDIVKNILPAMVKHQFGVEGLLVILLLQGTFVCSLYRLYRNWIKTQENMAWYRMAFVSIVIWTFIALVTQFLLIATTSVEFMFLGATQMSAMVLVLIVGVKAPVSGCRAQYRKSGST